MTENIKRCYFCEVPYEYPSFFIEYVNEIYVCCETPLSCEFMIDKLNTIQDNIECPVCYKIKKTIELPTCNHRICLECCKTIYFGTSKNHRPKSSNEVAHDLLPNWIYDDEKFDEYDIFEDRHFNIEEKTYDELITIRNNLISERPEWMNAEEFINYENALFRYYKECQKADEEWEQYNQTKTKGNSKCPLCRMNSKYKFN